MNNLSMFEILVGCATIIGAVATVISIFNSISKNKQIMIGGRNNQQANGDIKNGRK